MPSECAVCFQFWGKDWITKVVISRHVRQSRQLLFPFQNTLAWGRGETSCLGRRRAEERMGELVSNLYLPRLPRLLRPPQQHTPSSFHLNFATVHHRNTYSRLIHFLVPPIHLFPTQRLVTITLLSSCHSILRGSGNAGTLSMTSCTNSSKEWNNCVS